MPLVYDELRKPAAHKPAQEKPGQTLQATALVHEAYLRLVASPGRKSGEFAPHWDGRGHFFMAAAEAMRRILIENARRAEGRIALGVANRRSLRRASYFPSEEKETLKTERTQQNDRKLASNAAILHDDARSMARQGPVTECNSSYSVSKGIWQTCTIARA